MASNQPDQFVTFINRHLIIFRFGLIGRLRNTIDQQCFDVEVQQTAAGQDVIAVHAVDENAGNHRERGGAVASSTTVCSAESRSAGTDCDLPPTAARRPMIGRSAA